ncbi:DUF3237 domain-containing protein [Streptosporangium saharense]|uniref:DUF3237 domain-containing protein n=1 Tax=Streptosporangium saharense TaxID=1706840 RepID=UPI0034430D9B
MRPPELEHVMTVTLTMVPGSLRRIEGVPGGGDRWSINVAGGVFEGPGMRGKVLPGGIENPHLRPDGSLMINARWLLEEEDGTVIYVRNRGIRRAYDPAKMTAWMTRSEPVTADDFYFRVVPTFETASPRFHWLTENIFVGRLEDPPTTAQENQGPTMSYFLVH